MTLSEIVVDRTRLPPVPVIVMVKVPRIADELAVNESVEVPGGVTGLGENEAVTPLGTPEAERVTGLAKPPRLVSVTVLTPGAPLRTIVRDVGLAEIVKSGPGSTRRVIVVCLTRVPFVPDIVTV